MEIGLSSPLTTLGDPKLAGRIEPFVYGKSVCATESIAA
jgi:hypothetical protein